MRTDLAALVLAVALAGGCASLPGAGRPTAAGSAAAITAGVSAGVALPADVRAFIADRDLCDHFRSEPWPEGGTAADRERRRELVEGVRTACAGTDRRLAALRQLHAGDAAVLAALSGYDSTIE